MAIRPGIRKTAIINNPSYRITCFVFAHEDNASVLGPLGSRTSFCTGAAGWGNVEASPVLEILLQIYCSGFQAGGVDETVWGEVPQEDFLVEQ